LADRQFVDRYEILQLNQNAGAETIERVYRLLAKRYHPDNQETGNADKFAEVHESYEILSDPVKRAAYDASYDDQRGQLWKIFDQQSAGSDRDQDRRLSHGILSLLYIARRRDPRRGGLGSVHLEKMLGCPQEHLQFPLWYLKQRGAIEILDTGQYAITVDGVDQLTSMDATSPMAQERLLPASSLKREED
jgi:curved DNA-binding protein CbpA